MPQSEIESLINRRKRTYEQLLGQIYEKIEVNKEICFRLPSGKIITITPLYSAGALVIEYADDLAGAQRNTYEDGDLFFVENFTEAEMFQMMLWEINQ